MEKPLYSSKPNQLPFPDEFKKFECNLISTHSNSDLNSILESDQNSFVSKNYNQMEAIGIGKRNNILNSSHNTNSNNSILSAFAIKIPQVAKSLNFIVRFKRDLSDSMMASPVKTVFP